jgi:hypothetical protein
MRSLLSSPLLSSPLLERDQAMLVINRSEVFQLLPISDCISVLEDAFRMLGPNNTNKKKQKHTNSNRVKLSGMEWLVINTMPVFSHTRRASRCSTPALCALDSTNC